MASTGNSSIVKLTQSLQDLQKVAQQFHQLLTSTRKALESLHKALDMVRVVDEALKAFNVALRAVSAACQALGAVPVVGPIFVAAGRVVDALQKVVDQVSKVVSRVEKQVKPIRDKMPPIVDRLRRVEGLVARFEGLVGAELGNALGTDDALARAPRSRYRKAAEDAFAQGAAAITPGLTAQGQFLAGGSQTLGGIMKAVDMLNRLLGVATRPLEPVQRCTGEMDDKLPPLRLLEQTLGKEVFMGLTVVDILGGGLNVFGSIVRKQGEKLVMNLLRPLIQRALPEPSVGPAALLALPATFLRIASVLKDMFSSTNGLVPQLEQALSERSQDGLFAIPHQRSGSARTAPPVAAVA